MSFFQRLSAAAEARARKNAQDEYYRDYYRYGPGGKDSQDVYILNKYAANTKLAAPAAKQAARQLLRQGSSFASARSSFSRQGSGLSRQGSGLSRQGSGLSRQGSGSPRGSHGVRYSQSRKKWVWDDESRQQALETVKPKTHARR